MNVLTRTVLEMLIEQDVSIWRIYSGITPEVEDAIGAIEPSPVNIILKVLGLDDDCSDYVADLIQKVYEKELTITEVIDLMEQERELSVNGQ